MNEGDKRLGTAIQLAIYEKRGKLIIQALSIVRKLATFDVPIKEESNQDNVESLIREAKKIAEEIKKLED
jgi:hypothetical protein